MKIYNSLTNKKEEFEPLHGKDVKIYVCGITAYDVCHLGHLRGAVIFDVIRSYLRYRGYNVKFVKNITDVDDKIIQRARDIVQEDPNKYKDLKEATKSITSECIKKYYEDMEKFKIEKADIEPKATEHIGAMIDTIKRIIKNGHAYVVGSDVYFDVLSLKGYGKLSNQDLENLIQGERKISSEKKKNGLDFALWKSAKEDEPSWDSPWGKGRPGWHIECSAMSSKYLGEVFDIHGGGIDLIFPHHENEIAQSEAAFKKPFAKTWMHNGLLTINGEKMAKSLDNFITIKAALAKYDAESIRLFMVSCHYRHPIDFTDERMKEVMVSRERFYVFFDKISRITGCHQPSGSAKLEAEDKDFNKNIEAMKNKFVESMDDDFNTPAALAALFDIVSATNAYLANNSNPNCLSYARNTIFELGALLGLFKDIMTGFNEEEQRMITGIASKYLESSIEVSEDPKLAIEKLISLRNQAREDRDFKKADAIRKDLIDARITLEDEKEKTFWRKV